MKHLKNKVVVITGASRGIGQATAKAFAEAGAHVICVARSEHALAEVTAEIEALGGKATAFPADLSRLDQIPALVQRILETTRTIDVLVNNAGVGTFKALTDCTFDEVIQPMFLPYGAALAMTRAVLPEMKARNEGHIVNLTSPAGYFHLPLMTPYGSARHAMVGFSLSLYEEMAGSGIGVSLVCPPQVNTGYFETNDADMNQFPKIAKVFPVFEPEPVAEKIVEAVRRNRREMIFPFILKFFIRFYQKVPRFTIRLLKLTGLWR